MGARFTALLSLSSRVGNILATVVPISPNSRLFVNTVMLELTFWVEVSGLLRGRLKNPSAGVAAYFQGAEAQFRDLASTINLAASKDKPDQ